MDTKEDWVVVVGVEGVEDGAHRCVQRYPDGDVRVAVGNRSVVVPAGSWTECLE